MSANDEFLALETEFDRLARDARVSSLPRRSLVTGLLIQVHSMIHGGIADGAVPRVSEGRALLARLSYLLGVFDSAPPEPTGASAENAMLPFREDPSLLGDQLYLAQYGHLCELIPEVRRGWRTVSGSHDSGFVLRHPSPDFAQFEARDVVLAELAMGFIVPPDDTRGDLFDAICDAPGLDGRLIVAASEFAQYYQGACVEVALFDEDAWRSAVGVSSEEFDRFRAGWLGWAEACFGMYDALRRRIRRGDNDDERLGNELLEWAVPYLKPNFVEGVVIGVSGMSPDSFDRLMHFFAHEPGARRAGDGFFPPFHRVGDGLLLATDAIRSMLQSRNIAYALNREDPTRFAELLSHRLEPELLAQAEQIMRRLPGVVTRLNVRWAHGEVDLLAFDETTNTALHVQAKAPVPPQGARMTAAVEKRALEGLDQLRGLREQPPSEVDRVVSAALGRSVSGVALHEMLLVRTCLGTSRVWSSLGGVAPTNPHLLEASVQRLEADGAGLDRLATTAVEVLDELVSTAVVEWEEADVDFGLARVQVPLLRLDEAFLAGARVRFRPGV